MCHFITAVLSSEAYQASLDALARKHGRIFQPLSNPSIQRQLRQGQQYFRTTPGHCDCGTALGAGRRKGFDATYWAAEEQRLLKKGWSKTKIDRTMAQKRDKAASDDRGLEARASSGLAPWVGLIRETLDSGIATELGLLLHQYRGALDEDIPLQGAETIRTDDALADALRLMREDVLVTFVR
ncbi:hypothetical protein FCE95_14420 [Luteimonas gilva]|uniref:Uncharacterized protein n=1 Tax=Luteimonas gilva TaxID=2572684 RepID=A0A4U5JNH6_9GAMM|nr:hypothetical protein [Luteimonas gilva]TKR29347.1 hypothetical protein FCE95_14420 [Luteimonas gilva]